MRPTKPSRMIWMAPLAVTLLMGLGGCVDAYYGNSYGDQGSEWDGQLVVVGGNDGGYRRDDHAQAFHNEGGGRPASVGSARGRASMGARAGGGGHASSGGGRK
jgi:hypothetical protein